MWSDCNDEQWDGVKSLDGDETIGQLLDLDEGTLTVYKNGRRLGVMKSDCPVNIVGLLRVPAWSPCQLREARCLNVTSSNKLCC